MNTETGEIKSARETEPLVQDGILLTNVSDNEIKMLNNNFKYHSPKEGQNEKYETIRAKGKVLAAIVLNNCPPSRERSTAMTKIEEAVMWANASIARN